MQKQD